MSANAKYLAGKFTTAELLAIRQSTERNPANAAPAGSACKYTLPALALINTIAAAILLQQEKAMRRAARRR